MLLLLVSCWLPATVASANAVGAKASVGTIAIVFLVPLDFPRYEL